MTSIAIVADELTDVALRRIIETAALLSKDKSLDVWREVYEPAKRAIAEFDLTPSDYQAAVSRLTEAMRV